MSARSDCVRTTKDEIFRRRVQTKSWVIQRRFGSHLKIKIRGSKFLDRYFFGYRSQKNFFLWRIKKLNYPLNYQLCFLFLYFCTLKFICFLLLYSYLVYRYEFWYDLHNKGPIFLQIYCLEVQSVCWE